MAVRIVVGEDNLIVREGVQRLLASSPGMEVVAACGDLDALVAAIERERPAVVLTDIRMPPTKTDEGIRLAAELRATHPETGVVVLSQYSQPEYALELLDGGSDRRGYLLKERVSDPTQLLRAIDTIARGGSVVDSKIVDVLVEARTRTERYPFAELTAREREVLAQIAAGRSNSAIADSLVLTKRAVEKHINSIFKKLDLVLDEDISKRVTATLMFLMEQQGPAAAADGDRLG